MMSISKNADWRWLQRRRDGLSRLLRASEREQGKLRAEMRELARMQGEIERRKHLLRKEKV
jgi:hypothetical protein